MSVRSDPNRYALLMSGLALLILSPLLLFGPAPDPGIFYIGGVKIVHGGAYYADILDIKPPFIYWYYASAIRLFGESFISVRILDLIIQTLFTFFLSRSMLRIGYSRGVTLATLVIYCLVYIGLGPGDVTQLESYTGLLLLPATLLQLRARRTGLLRDYLWTGLVLGLGLLVKPTFGLLLVGWILYEFLRPVLPAGRRIGFLAAGSVIALLPYAIWGIVSVSGPHSEVIAEINDFIYRRHIYLLSELGGLKGAWGMFSRNWGIGFGPGLLVLAVIGLLVLLRRRSGRDGSAGGGVEKGESFSEVLVIQGGMLLLSCAVELWFFPYHISRLLLPTALLAGIGTAAIMKAAARWREYGRFQQVVGLGGALLLLAYSPVFLWISGAYRPLLTLVRTGSLYEAQAASLGEFPMVPKLRELELHERMTGEVDSSSFFIISPNVGLLHTLSGTVPRGDLIHGHQITSAFTPQLWVDRVRHILEVDAPEYILVEWNDPSIAIQGVGSVEEALEKTGLLQEIRERYDEAASNDPFILLQRREGADAEPDSANDGTESR